MCDQTKLRSEGLKSIARSSIILIGFLMIFSACTTVHTSEIKTDDEKTNLDRAQHQRAEERIDSFDSRRPQRWN